MKVLYIQRVLPTYRAEYFLELAKADQIVLHVSAGQPIAGESIEVIESLPGVDLEHGHNRYYFQNGTSYLGFHRKELLPLLERTRPHAVICEANPRFFGINRLARACRKNKIPLIGHGLGTMRLSGSNSPLRTVWHKIFLTAFDGLIAYSSKGRDDYQAAGFAKHRLFVAVNAVRTGASMPPLPIKPLGGIPRIAILGRLIPSKRPELILEAAKHVRTKFQLCFIGEGPLKDTLTKVAIASKVDAIFTGHLDGSQLRQALETCHLCVLPGLGGLAIQDAMASGLPVIVADGDGTQFDYVSPQTGWHCLPNSPHHLASILNEALSNPGALRQKGEAAYELVKNRLNVEQMVKQTLNAISACLFNYH